MGRLATVQAGFTGVLLPSTSGVWADYNAGNTVVLSEAEAILPSVASLVTGGVITLAASGTSAEPTRPGTDKFAEPNTNIAQFTAATGGVVTVGVNNVTGPAAGVTYSAAGFLAINPNNTSVIPAVVGPVAGSQSTLEVYHTQGAVVSVAPTAKPWIYSRLASVTTTNSSPVVADATATLNDQGRTLTGAGIPASSFVGTVTPGVGYRISSSATSQVDVNATASATVNAQIGANVKWPAGTVPTFTASVGAVDYFQFVTYDGGYNWFNILTVKGLA